MHPTHFQLTEYSYIQLKQSEHTKWGSEQKCNALGSETQVAMQLERNDSQINYLQLSLQLNLLFLHSLMLLLQLHIKLQPKHGNNNYEHILPLPRFTFIENKSYVTHTSLRFSARSVQRKTGPDGTVAFPTDDFASS
jgi:hypothetical protein